MDNLTLRAEALVDAAVRAVERGDSLLDALDALQAPIYVTDAEGLITHFSRACIGFAGRTPAAGKDRWCVTWRLYTEDGVFLPHDQCPMAVTIHEKKPVRGARAVAERPDGTRVTFQPFPTPVFDDDGQFVGAVNLFIDVTEHRQIAELRDKAAKCRRMARHIGDRRTV
ncbi:MAG: PAS domain S-box protein, partial [Caulobacteraceae bacterium]